MQVLASVITPTANRAQFLDKCLRYFQAQTCPFLEWLVWDDGLEPHPTLANAAPNIRYVYSDEKLSVGEKRNRLIAMARGEFIVQFDDDDYYHPTYITQMLNALHNRQADILNLRGWYLYDMRWNFFGYWNLSVTQGLHYQCARDNFQILLAGDEFETLLKNNHLGYGFGYVFRRKVWESIKFADVNFNEDGVFTLNAIDAGFKADGILDRDGICLHFLHPQSSSCAYPQYHLPNVSLANIFPDVQLPSA